MNAQRLYSIPVRTFTEEQAVYWHEEKHRKRRDPSNPVIRAYVERKIDFVLRSIGSVATVLDVGAGNGYFSAYWGKRAAVTAVDYSPVILEGNPVVDKRVMDARQMTFPDGMFDLSFCHALLHHIDHSDQVTVIREMARVSTGYVAIIEPNVLNPIMGPFALLKKEEHGALRFTRRYLQQLVEQAGLHIIASCSWGLLTPNRMPIPIRLLPLMAVLERPILFGVCNIVIARRPA